MKQTFYVLGAIAVAAILAVSCSKQESFEGNNSIQESTSNTDDVQNKKYTLDQSNTTGRWHWQCKHPDSNGNYDEGWSDTKSGAKDDAKDAKCPSGAAIISPPFNELEFQHATLSEPEVFNEGDGEGGFLDDLDLNELGTFEGVTVFNLDGDLESYNSNQLSFDEVVYWLGDEDYAEISDARKATVLLTVMGVYNGGSSSSEIQSIHNLSAQQFEQLINREFGPESELDIDDETGAMSWIF